MSFRNGYLYFVNPCSASIPIKPKFVICMSSDDKLFYLVNSCTDVRPYQYELNDVVYIEPLNLRALSHRSYVNVSKPRCIDDDDYDNAVELDYMANDLWLKIKKKVSENRKIGAKIKSIIAQMQK